MNTKNKTQLTLTALAVAALSACSLGPPPKLVIDSAMADANVFEVDGLTNRYWGKPLTFGPYHTEKTRVGDTWNWSVGLFGREVGAQVDPYRFHFVDDAGDRYQVECRSKTPMLRRSTRHSEWSFPLGETKLSCAIKDPAGNVASLAMHGGGGDYAGETGFADIEDFEISAVREFSNSQGRTYSIPTALGWELRQGGQVVAMVDTFDHGVVYLGRNLGPRERSAAALTLTVLMFFDEA